MTVFGVLFWMIVMRLFWILFHMDHMSQTLKETSQFDHNEFLKQKFFQINEIKNTPCNKM